MLSSNRGRWQQQAQSPVPSGASPCVSADGTRSVPAALARPGNGYQIRSLLSMYVRTYAFLSPKCGGRAHLWARDARADSARHAWPTHGRGGLKTDQQPAPVRQAAVRGGFQMCNFRISAADTVGMTRDEYHPCHVHPIPARLYCRTRNGPTKSRMTYACVFAEMDAGRLGAPAGGQRGLRRGERQDRTAQSRLAHLVLQDDHGAVALGYCHHRAGQRGGKPTR